MLSDDDARARLVDEIKAGRCVAFVGAGFSAPVCRPWGKLLEAIAGAVHDAAVGDEVRALVARGAANDYEVAAQMLEDAFAGDSTARLLEVVRAHTPRPAVEPAFQEQMDRRRAHLLGIPFASILTTNFDDVLHGAVLDADTYGTLLREADRRWLETRFWKQTSTPVLKLHGDLRGEKGITLSRRGYRARLYTEPGYLNALRTVFLTKTILFLGFSFSDGYLNELRSEALSYLGKDASTLAYAVLPDARLATRAHYAKHEGIHVFSYESAGNTDHDYVDRFLGEVHAATDPTRVIGGRLRDKRILWVDQNTHHNVKGHRYLSEAAQGLCTIDLALRPDDAIARLRDVSYDLVITRWGHHVDREADAIALLRGMRRDDVCVPVVVFASGDHGDENRETALRLGALEYTSHWETLCEVIDRRFGPRP